MGNLKFLQIGYLLIVTEVTIPFQTYRFNLHLLRIMVPYDLIRTLESVQLPQFTDEKMEVFILVIGKVRLETNPPNSQFSPSIRLTGHVLWL